MQSEFEEEIREFLIESNESLSMLDQQIVELESDPESAPLISSIFRTIHSIKGTCGFFGFDILGSVTHLAESILMQLRDRQRPLTPELISLILEAIDAVKLLLARIESTGSEGEDETAGLRERLDEAYRNIPGSDGLQAILKAAERHAEDAAPPPPVQPLPATVPDAQASTRAMPGDLSTQDAPAAATAPEAKVSRPPAVERTAKAEGAEKAEKADKPSPTEAGGELQVTDSTIRVDVNLLNQLMNLVGELVLTRNQLLQASGGFTPAVQQTSQRLNIITSELQEGVMKTRMQPIGVIWNKLPRVVRDLSSKCGKQIQLDMQGAATELDKSLIEAIRDPLTHIVRNSCDHGIEQPAERQKKGKPPMGTLSLRAFHEAGAVNIEIADDGAGINADRVRAKAIEKKLITPDQAAAMSTMEAVNLIFLPGFSTADQITSLSGRGVGMDVVKTNIEKISGSVEVFMPPHGGTSIRIKIPLTLAIIPGLIVSSNLRPSQAPGREDRFVIPQSHLVEMTRVDMTASPCLVETVHGATIFRHRGKLLPLVYLSRLLKRETEYVQHDQINVIILQVAGQQFGLVVDRICDTQEIVVKPLGQQLKHLACYGGATIMGDGQPALILDVGGIAKLAGLEAGGSQGAHASQPGRPRQVTSEMLLFCAGTHRRLGLPLSIVNRLEEIPVESLEHAAGDYVVAYRGELLPLFHVEQFLQDVPAPLALPGAGRLKVVVINNGPRRLGLIVDEILDIVDGVIDVMRSSTSPGVLGSAVIGGAVTDLLDATAMHDRAKHSWSRAADSASYTHRVLFYDPSPLSREMMHTFLRSAGFLHCHAASAAEMRDALQEAPVDVLLVTVDGDGVPAWWSECRGNEPRLAGATQIVLSNTREITARADKGIGSTDRAISRYDRAAILGGLTDAVAAIAVPRQATRAA